MQSFTRTIVRVFNSLSKNFIIYYIATTCLLLVFFYSNVALSDSLKKIIKTSSWQAKTTESRMFKMQLDTKSEAQLDTQSEVQLDTQSEVQLDTQSEVQLDTQPEAQLDTKSEAQLDIQDKYSRYSDSDRKKKNSGSNVDMKLFNKVLELTKKNHVQQVDESKLLEAALDGMLSDIDPHSTYLNQEEYKDLKQQTKGEFGGVGIEITQKKSMTKIVSPIEDTPGFRAGLKSGDVITAVDGTSIIGLPLFKVVRKIRGKVNTNVVLTISRSGVPKKFDVTIKRAIIKIVPVKSRLELGNIAYIKITSFSELTYPSLRKHYNKLQKKSSNNLQGIILDLRNNPGGLLSQSIKVSDMFLPKRTKIVSTRPRDKSNNKTFFSKMKDQTNGLPVVVLINQGSASASEIVAGALQDNKRAIILGTRSFGKGSVQSIIPLGNQGAVKLTISRYYTPNGSSIQSYGIVPDVIAHQIKLSKDESEIRSSYTEESLQGHLDTGSKEIDQEMRTRIKDSEEFYKKLMTLYKKDYQLARAVDLVLTISKQSKIKENNIR